MKTRYEVFRKKSFEECPTSPRGYLRDFEDLTAAKKYVKSFLETQRDNQVLLESLIICEVTYKPVFEIENHVSITTTEKDL
jgi:hypothetical protein